MNLFRHLVAHTAKEEPIDMGNLGEVVAYPPPGVPSLASDPCDETMPGKRGVSDVPAN